MMHHHRPAARHLRLITEEPPPLDARTAREAVGDGVQLMALQLMDRLEDLRQAHDDPAAAARDVAELRRNLVHIVDYTFQVAEDKIRLRRHAP